jgi:hypothetical protein
MEKKTVYAIVAAALLGLGAFAILRQPEKGQRVGPPPRPVPVVKAADVARIEVANEKQEKTVLDRKGMWRVSEPKDWPADQAAVKALLDGFEKLTFADMVTESPDKFADMGVADGKATRVTLKGASGNIADLLVGKAVSGYTMVRPAGKNEVWQSSGLYGYMLNKDSKGWRDHNILEFSQNDCDRLTVDAGSTKLVLDKIPAEGGQPAGAPVKWKIAESVGDGPKVVEQLDGPMVTGAVQALASLKASDFADDKKPEELGLSKPWLTVTARVLGKDFVVQLGSSNGDSSYVKTPDSPTLYVANKYAMERVAHKPVDYKDKTLTQVKESEVASVDVTVGKETWSAERGADGKWKGKGKSPVDDTKVKPIVSAFDNLSGASFADEKDPKKNGLAQPSAMVALHLKDKSTVTVKVGAVKGADIYVQRAGSENVFMIKKYLADRFTKKAAEVSPNAKPSGPEAALAAEHQRKGKK